MDTFPAKETCTKQCTVTRVNIQDNGKEDGKWIGPFLKLKFDNRVVYKTKVLGYGFSDFLIDMGSSLGLWFGLSVFGITDFGILAWQSVKKLNQKLFKK